MFYLSGNCMKATFDHACKHAQSQKKKKVWDAQEPGGSRLGIAVYTDKDTIPLETGALTNLHIKRSRVYMYMFPAAGLMGFIVNKLWQCVDVIPAAMNNTPDPGPRGKSTWPNINAANSLTGKMHSWLTCQPSVCASYVLKEALTSAFTL